MENKLKALSIILVSLLVLTILISNVSAYTRLCLSKGQVIPSKQKPMFTCKHDLCMICVNDKYFPSNPNYCNDKAGCSIMEGGDSGEIDTSPPNISINSPSNNKIYNSKNILFDISTSEPASIYYKDNSDNKNQWKPVSKKLTQSFKNGLSFKEGLNDISIKAVDKKGNEKIISVKFTIDSQKPKIKTTSPTKGFSDGNFSIQFTENNPKSLKLFYGNSIKGQKSIDINLNNCAIEKGFTSCYTKIDLQDYNNQQISYYFYLEDIANNKIQSKTISLNVDTTPPIINNINSILTLQGKSGVFDIIITEPNFQDVSYLDNSIRNPKWNKICTSLKNGRCTKKITFTKGDHDLIIKISDKAGNIVTKSASFTIT